MAINMSYCMCENTYKAFDEMLERLNEGKTLSAREAKYFRWLLESVLEYCEENDIIEAFDTDAIESTANCYVDDDEEDDE